MVDYTPTTLRVSLGAFVDLCPDERLRDEKSSPSLKEELSALPIYLSDMDFNWLTPGCLCFQDVVDAVSAEAKWKVLLFMKWLTAYNKAFTSKPNFGTLQVLKGGIVNLNDGLRPNIAAGIHFYESYIFPKTLKNMGGRSGEKGGQTGCPAIEGVRELFLLGCFLEDVSDLDDIRSFVESQKECRGLFLQDNKLGSKACDDASRVLLSDVLFKILDIGHLLHVNISKNEDLISLKFRDSFFSRLPISSAKKLTFLEGLESLQWETLFEKHPHKDNIVQVVRQKHGIVL